MRNHVLNLPSYSYFGLARRIVALSTVCLLLAGCGGMVSSSRDLETKTAKAPHIAWVTPAAIPYSTALSAAQLNATADVPGDFSYAPSQGTVLSAGTHTLSVTFTPTDSADYATASANVTLAVNRATPVLSWAPPAAIPYGMALSAVPLDATADVPGAFAYAPSLSAVLPTGPHTLSVNFTPADTTNYSTASASSTLTVNQAAPVLGWTAPAAISYGTALSAAQLNASASVPGTFSYTPSLGTVLAAGSHTLSVTFTPTDATDYSSASASVTLKVNESAPVLSWTAPIAISYGTALSAAQLNASASVPGTFSYTPSFGTVLAAGSHTLSVTFNPTDASDYSSATASSTLTVNQSAPVLSWTAPAAISYGTALSAAQLNATASVPGTFAYTPSLGTVLASGSHTLSVTFTPADATDYSSATASVTLTVNELAPVLSWTAPAAISYGTALSASQLNATASVPGTFSYTPSFGTVLSVGSHTLSVTFNPTDAMDYSSATASVTLSVSESAPVLSWTAPAAIPYGTALSAAQLNASASVPGTFAYTPSLGTVLSVGTHTLSVTFTPTDATDYAPTTASVALTVNQATPRITWAPAAPIAVGMALGPDQLNATATAPGNTAKLTGSFLYTPAAGTTLTESGALTLSVTFTPADTVDYTTAEATITPTVAAFGVAAWGDSLTSGNQGVFDRSIYPSQLQPLTTLAVKNQGVSGQTSTQIGVREGGIPVHVTVAGGSIPATGGVRVTFPSGYEPVTSEGPAGGVTGTILGVHGTVTLVSGVSIFMPTEPGSVVSAPGSPQFVVDTPYAGYLPVFWEGRNNVTAKSQILSDIAAQVATVPSNQNYLVMSIINQDIPAEWIGESTYGTIIDLNNQLANKYGARYLDIRKALVDSYDSTQATEVSSFEHDVVPTSLHSVYGSGTLVNSIGPTDTVFAVNLTAGSMYVNNILTIDTGENAENVMIHAVSGSTVTVTRNWGGLNTSHAEGAPVTDTDAMHLNAQGYQIVANAVAKYLSANENQE